MGCPVSGADVTGTLANGSVVVHISGIGDFTVPFSQLGGGNVQTKAGRLQAILQAKFDMRIPLIELPSDDPDKFNDPGKTGSFWSDADGIPRSGAQATHITGRNCIIHIDLVGSGANTTVAVWFEGTTL